MRIVSATRGEVGRAAGVQLRGRSEAARVRGSRAALCGFIACGGVVIAACGARTELQAPNVVGRSGADAGSVDDADTVDSGEVGLAPIDPACTMGGSGATVYPPYVPLTPPDVPASCANGFELGDATSGSVYTLDATTPGGAAAITLDVDYATYREPDGVVITGIDASGNGYTLLDSCRLQTWDQSDPTGGTSRPPDYTIRQFRVDVEAGTASLTFNFAGVVSPMYIQVLGLCDFAVSPDPNAVWWQSVP